MAKPQIQSLYYLVSLENILADYQHGFRSQRSCETQFFHDMVSINLDRAMNRGLRQTDTVIIMDRFMPLSAFKKWCYMAKPQICSKAAKTLSFLQRNLALAPRHLAAYLNLNGLLVTRQIDNTSPGGCGCARREISPWLKHWFALSSSMQLLFGIILKQKRRRKCSGQQLVGGSAGDDTKVKV